MSFVVKFFQDMLYKLGLWKKNAKIVFLGLDNAGKSTLLSVLKTGRVTQLDPTKHAHSEHITIKNVNMNAFDLGGHEAMRKIWREYFPKIDAIVYLIDAADPSRFAESKAEFDRIVAAMTALPNTSALVIGHADQRGSDVANYVLSAQRADATVQYLASKGIDPSRLSSRAVGESDLLTLNNDAASLALNKRTEFVLFGLLDI